MLRFVAPSGALLKPYERHSDKFFEVFVKLRFCLWSSLSPRSGSYLVLERAWPGFNTVSAALLTHAATRDIEQHAPPDQPCRVTLVSLERRRSTSRNDAGRSAISLSSNRHDRGE